MANLWNCYIIAVSAFVLFSFAEVTAAEGQADTSQYAKSDLEQMMACFEIIDAEKELGEYTSLLQKYGQDHEGYKFKLFVTMYKNCRGHMTSTIPEQLKAISFEELKEFAIKLREYILPYDQVLEEGISTLTSEEQKLFDETEKKMMHFFDRKDLQEEYLIYSAPRPDEPTEEDDNESEMPLYTFEETAKAIACMELASWDSMEQDVEFLAQFVKNQTGSVDMDAIYHKLFVSTMEKCFTRIMTETIVEFLSEPWPKEEFNEKWSETMKPDDSILRGEEGIELTKAQEEISSRLDSIIENMPEAYTEKIYGQEDPYKMEDDESFEASDYYDDLQGWKC